MIGGLLKSSSRVALVAAAGLVTGGVAAQAADLGGNCCADLEERVAELEATTVRKGNRKVSLTVSGWVNEAVLFWDDGFEQNTYVVTNSHSQSRFRFRGSATVNADWSAGFYMEYGLQRTGQSGDSLGTGADQLDEGGVNGLNVRHQALYVKSRTFGTVWLGHTSDAIDGITQICLGCVLTNVVEHQLGYGGGMFANVGNVGAAGGVRYIDQTLGGDLKAGADLDGGNRKNNIKWISPTFVGFSLSGSWGADDHWAAALRYAGEFGTIRVAGGIGYSENTDTFVPGTTPAVPAGTTNRTIAGSATLQHVPSGLYIAGAAGEGKNGFNALTGGRDDKDIMWWVGGGWGSKWWGWGKTTIHGSYNNYDAGYIGAYNFIDPQNGGALTDSGDEILGSDMETWSIGLHQAIDAAAMEMYITYYNVNGNISTRDNGRFSVKGYQSVITGARIRF